MPRSLYMPSCVNMNILCRMCRNRLLCSHVHAYAALHPRTWHCRLSVIRRARVCARMQRVGATGQGQGHGGACVLVLGEHAAARVGHCTGQQRGCGVLHVPLMSFLGQARPWGELISKQATERSPYSPLPLPPLPPLLPLLLALQLIALFFCSFSLLFSLPLCFRCCELSLPSTLQFSLCLFFLSLSLSSLVGREILTSTTGTNNLANKWNHRQTGWRSQQHSKYLNLF